MHLSHKLLGEMSIWAMLLYTEIVYKHFCCYVSTTVTVILKIAFRNNTHLIGIRDPTDVGIIQSTGQFTLGLHYIL